MLAVDAPAKVNLTLEVLGKRPDGFHEIRSVFQAISLSDRVTVQEAGELTLACSAPELTGPDNLAWRAAALLRQATGSSRGAAIRLDKRIPVAAGLGGGSSDAAATLAALNTCWGLGLSRPELREIGAQLGSDVPFFLGGSSTALVEGRGERLTPLPPLPPRWLVLVKPPTGIAAAAAYGALLPEWWSDGRRTDTWLRAATKGYLPLPFNDLEPAALATAPAAALAREILLASGAPSPIMSGSGSTYFALFEAPDAAAAAAARVATEVTGCAGWTVTVAEFLPALPRVTACPD